MILDKEIVPDRYERLDAEVLHSVDDLEALGMWCYLRGRPTNWVIREKQVREKFGIGRDKYQRIMRQLRSIGLIELQTGRAEDGKLAGRTLCVKANLPAAESGAHRTSENPTFEEPNHLNKTDSLYKTESINKASQAKPEESQQEADERFEQFWTEYPRRVAKARARTAWRNLSQRDQKACLAYVKCKPYSGVEEKYTPHPSTFLNQRRWEDESQPIPDQPQQPSSPAMRGVL